MHLTTDALGAFFYGNARRSRRSLDFRLCGLGGFFCPGGSFRAQRSGGFGPTTFGRKLPHVVGHENRALKHDFLARLAGILLHRQIGTHSALEALDVFGRYLERSQQQLRGGTIVRLDSLDAARFDIERDVVHVSDSHLVCRHDGKPAPHHARIPIDSH